MIWATGDGHVWRLRSVDGENRCTLQRVSDGFADVMRQVSVDDWRGAVACASNGHYFVAAGSQGFWLDDADHPVWYRWVWQTPFRALAVCAGENGTGLLMTDGAGRMWGCTLAGDTDGLPAVGTPVSVVADTGLLFGDRSSRRRVLQMQLRLDGQAVMTPYDEYGEGAAVSVGGVYGRLPVRRAGGRQIGLRLTATAPFTLYCGRVFRRP